MDPGPVADRYPIPEGALRTDCTGERGGELRYALPGEPNSFNYANVTDARTQLVTYLITGTLLEFDRREQVIREGLADTWQVSPDGLSVTLSLRTGVRFSDGTPLSSDDVVSSFRKISDPNSNNPLKSSLEIDGRLITVERIDERQIRVHFPKPYAAAEYLLTGVPVFPAHLLSDQSRPIEDYWNLGTSPREMAGLGAFVLEEHEPGRRTTFVRNPHYWKTDRGGRRLPYLDRLTVDYVEDRNSQLLRFQAGELDLLDYQLRPQDFVQLKNSRMEAQLLNAGPSTHLTFLWFNQGCDRTAGAHPEKGGRCGWFQNVRFRRSVAAAISRGSVVRNVFLGEASAAFSLMPPTVPAWYLDIGGMDQDLGAARRELAGAGFRWEGEADVLVDGDGNRVEFELLTRADDVWGKTAALIQQDLEPLGMTVRIVTEDFRSVISRITGSREYDSALLAIELPFEPAGQLGTFLSSSPGHFWNPSQPKPATRWEARVDELMLLQVTALDPASRRQLYRESQELLVDNAAIIPIVHRDVLVAARPGLRNLRPANLYPNSLWNAWELWTSE